MKKYMKYIISGTALVLVLLVAFASITIIQSGTVGVISTMGAVSDQPMTQGMHFRIPFFTTVVKMDIKTLIFETDCSAASRDLQTISSKMALNYHVNSETAPKLYREIGIGYQTVIIAPAIQESVKAVTAKFSAEELITRRQEVSVQIREDLSDKLLPYGIIVDLFNITNLEFSDAFNASIEAKQIAQQDALKAEQELIKVKIEAQQQVERAKAEAEAKRAIADADAYAIEKLQEQLSKSFDYIEYEKIQKWDGKLPQVQGDSNAIIDLRDNQSTTPADSVDPAAPAE